MTRWATWRPLLTAALVSLSVVFAALALARGPSGPLGGLVGVALLVPFQGYALTRALFGDRELDPAERLVLVLGLGLGSAILCGMVLGVAPVGMSGASWAGLLAGVTVLALMIGALREMGALRATVSQPPLVATPRASGALVRPVGRDSVRQVAMLAAAAVIALSAMVVARVGATEQAYPGFTQLWALAADGDTLTVGVMNREGSAQSYMLRLVTDGASGSDDRAIELADGETWQAALAIPAGEGASLIEVQLFRPGDTDPYRRVSSSIGDAEAGGGADAGGPTPP